VWAGVPPPHLSPTGMRSGEGTSPDKFIKKIFLSKKTGFYAFLLRKTTCGQKLGGGSLIDPPVG